MFRTRLISNARRTAAETSFGPRSMGPAQTQRRPLGQQTGSDDLAVSNVSNRKSLSIAIVFPRSKAVPQGRTAHRGCIACDSALRYFPILSLLSVEIQSFDVGTHCLCCAMPVFKSECEQVCGCHDLGVFDKVVRNLVSSPFHNRNLRRLHEISLILKIHRRHGLVADSKTVAPIP